MVRNCTPSRATLATPRATVLPMSWSFMSRKTRLPARERQPAGERQLIADLVEHHRIAEALDHRLGGAHVIEIERHDQLLARLHAAFPQANRRAISTSRPTTRLSRSAAVASLSSSMSSNA